MHLDIFWNVYLHCTIYMGFPFGWFSIRLSFFPTIRRRFLFSQGTFFMYTFLFKCMQYLLCVVFITIYIDGFVFRQINVWVFFFIFIPFRCTWRKKCFLGAYILLCQWTPLNFSSTTYITKLQKEKESQRKWLKMEEIQRAKEMNAFAFI